MIACPLDSFRRCRSVAAAYMRFARLVPVVETGHQQHRGIPIRFCTHVEAALSPRDPLAARPGRRRRSARLPCRAGLQSPVLQALRRIHRSLCGAGAERQSPQPACSSAPLVPAGRASHPGGGSQPAVLQSARQPQPQAERLRDAAAAPPPPGSGPGCSFAGPVDQVSRAAPAAGVRAGEGAGDQPKRRKDVWPPTKRGHQSHHASTVVAAGMPVRARGGSHPPRVAACRGHRPGPHRAAQFAGRGLVRPRRAGRALAAGRRGACRAGHYGQPY